MALVIRTNLRSSRHRTTAVEQERDPGYVLAKDRKSIFIEVARADGTPVDFHFAEGSSATDERNDPRTHTFYDDS